MYKATKKISKDIMKQYNQKLVLRILKENGATSKSELSKYTGLTLPAIADIMDALEKLNLIKNLGESRTQRGRFPTLYELERSSFKVIGIIISSRSIRVGLYNMLGEVLSYVEKELPSDTCPENILDQVSNLIDNLLHDSKTSKSDINGIGLGMHGIVDYINGISVYPPHLNWDNVPVKELLEKKIGLPVLIDNDCNTLALAEYWFGTGRNLDSFITVNVDYGIGAGIMIDGKLFHGRDFGAGQIGHTIVHDNGPQCSCGNYGCLEVMSSEVAIVENVVRKIKKGFPSSITNTVTNPDEISTKHIYNGAKDKDDLALETLESAARYLGIGISTLVNVINPDKVIITGGFITAKNDVMNPLHDSFKRHALKTNVNNFEIVPSELGDKAGVLGAATLWINELFMGELSLDNLRNKDNKATV
ncbi:ROK family transcriptional regulator [Gracilibacillus sp. YIM 98692]|uniref:ROK family transcriptional regulator n=1 Tax=Gracilibacillus sp. YIM 98692 TaxID=2663532 RepID=UPI0013D3659D|nr:ROK family transcriptional regulator [Gracilibacillus sp. YIM 98692]